MGGRTAEKSVGETPPAEPAEPGATAAGGAGLGAAAAAPAAAAGAAPPLQQPREGGRARAGGR
jgi:hypothetical protein